MKTASRRVSFAELQQWPDDGRRYELYDGEVIVVPAPIVRHQRVMQHLGDLLMDYERATGGLVVESPVDVVLSEHNVVQPDVVFVRHERRGLIDAMQAIHVPPDLAVEVLSPSTAARDRGRKMRLLERFGVPEYWIVDPVGNTIEIFTLTGGRYTRAGLYDASAEVASPTLPQLTFPAARVFEP